MTVILALQYFQNKGGHALSQFFWPPKKPKIKYLNQLPYILHLHGHSPDSGLFHEHIYTDGSKDGEKVGCAAAKYDDCKQMRIPDGSSVFTAEAKAIDLALDFVNTCTYTDKYVIFSDSLSVLQALSHTSSKNSQIQHLLLKHHEISSSKTVIYCWIPSHIGIYGNEKVDKNAKESLNLEVTDFKIPFNNFKPFINKYVCDKWQIL